MGGTPYTIPAVPPTYKYTYISENGLIWGIPAANGSMPGLDAGGVARNVGGGIVGLPYTGHPFEAGQAVWVAGTSYYNGPHIVGAGTTANEIQFAAAYIAETFDGTETVVRKIVLPDPGNGSTVLDSSGNLYYGHAYNATKESVVTKITTDETEVGNFLQWPDAMTSSHQARTVALTSDDAYLYVLVSGTFDKIYKFDLSDGSLVWSTALTSPGYDLALDAAGNAYVRDGIAPYQYAIRKYDADTGAATTLTEMGQTISTSILGDLQYDVLVDDDLGIVIGGGWQYAPTARGDLVAALYNVAVRTFDDSAGGQLCVGDKYTQLTQTHTPTVGKDCIVSDGSYIYVLIIKSTTETTLHKLQWNGSTLSQVGSAAGPPYGCGLFFDLWGNLVVVNQDWTVHQDDLLWYYDTDLNYVTKVEGLYNGMLLTWDAIVGGAYVQGGILFNGALGTPASETTILGDDALPYPTRLQALVKGEDRYLLAFTQNQMLAFKVS